MALIACAVVLSACSLVDPTAGWKCGLLGPSQSEVRGFGVSSMSWNHCQPCELLPTIRASNVTVLPPMLTWAMPTPISPLPQPPTSIANHAWDQYRSELRRYANHGHIPVIQSARLIGVSYDEQEKLQQARQPSRATIFHPSTDHTVELRGARIREAAVLMVSRSAGLSAPEVLFMLERAGFSVSGARPLDVLRKALNSEVRGVVKRPPTLQRIDHTYTYIPESLSLRTFHRWNQRFPTLSMGWRNRHAG